MQTVGGDSAASVRRAAEGTISTMSSALSPEIYRHLNPTGRRELAGLLATGDIALAGGASAMRRDEKLARIANGSAEEVASLLRDETDDGVLHAALMRHRSDRVRVMLMSRAASLRSGDRVRLLRWSTELSANADRHERALETLVEAMSLDEILAVVTPGAESTPRTWHQDLLGTVTARITTLVGESPDAGVVSRLASGDRPMLAKLPVVLDHLLAGRIEGLDADAVLASAQGRAATLHLLEALTRRGLVLDDARMSIVLEDPLSGIDTIRQLGAVRTSEGALALLLDWVAEHGWPYAWTDGVTRLIDGKFAEAEVVFARMAERPDLYVDLLIHVLGWRGTAEQVDATIARATRMIHEAAGRDSDHTTRTQLARLGLALVERAPRLDVEDLIAAAAAMRTGWLEQWPTLDRVGLRSLVRVLGAAPGEELYRGDQCPDLIPRLEAAFGEAGAAAWGLLVRQTVVPPTSRLFGDWLDRLALSAVGIISRTGAAVGEAFNLAFGDDAALWSQFGALVDAWEGTVGDLIGLVLATAG